MLKVYSTEQISNAISLIAKEIPYSIVLGAEVEFYLQHDGKEDEQSVVDEIAKHCLRIEKEKGWRQYEFVLGHTKDILGLAQEIYDLRYLTIVEARKQGIKAVFDAKPFEADFGSALHFHLSIHDKTGVNIFAEETIATNEILQKIIQGILDLCDESIYLLCAENDDFNRFVPESMAPTCTCWGGNNRTTVIRIPDSEPKHRRIEFRIPPANADPFWSIFIILAGVHHGLNNNVKPRERIYGNAYDPKYELKQFPKSVEEAKNTFLNEKKLATYIEKFFPKLEASHG